MQNGFYESTQSESANLISNYFPNIPSEDVSSLLVAPEINSEDENSPEKNLDPVKIDEYNQEALLSVMFNPTNGEKIFDVMYSLGLKWGDMDIFHWENESKLGDDFYFDVFTTSDPGYFIPGDILKNKIKFRTLFFSFSIPRTYKPREVLESMIKAVEYTKDKLDGIVGGGDDFSDYQEIRGKVADIERKMTADGVKPGTNNALKQFY